MSDGAIRPFGRGDRTIIRPNPGARRPAAPASPAPPAPPPPAAPGGAPSAPPRSGSGGVGRGLDHDRRSARPVAADVAARRRAQASTTWSRRTRTRSCARPGRCCCCSAGCASRCCARSFASLMEQVADAIKFFEKDIRSAGIPEEQANLAKYILCATADDIVQNIPTEDRHVWTQYSMLSRFFGERIGGVRFFDELERAKTDPLINYSVLELQHACLALGFQGIHRTSAGGAVRAAADPAQSVRDACGACSRKVDRAICRRAGRARRSRATCRRSACRSGRSPPCSALLLFVLFLVLRYLLGGGTDTSRARRCRCCIRTRRDRRSPGASSRRRRRRPRRRPIGTQLQRIRRELAPEISAGKVSAEQTANADLHPRRRRGVVPGRAGRRCSTSSSRSRCASRRPLEQGARRHQDRRAYRQSTPINTRALSVELSSLGGAGEGGRRRCSSHGCRSPIASRPREGRRPLRSRRTRRREGRARNRRVEIVIPRDRLTRRRTWQMLRVGARQETSARVILDRRSGSASVSALVCIAGPLIAFGDYRPLDSYIVREHRHPHSDRRRSRASADSSSGSGGRSRGGAGAGHRRSEASRERRRRPQGQDEGRARDPEERERQQGGLPLRPALVPDDRPARAPARPRRWSIPA